MSQTEDPTRPSSIVDDRPTRDLETSPTRRTPESGLGGSAAPSPGPSPGPPSAGWPPAAGQQLPVGTLLADRYRVQATLGTGGMGIVYRVHDETLDLDLALKVLRPEIAHDSDFLQRFRNELLVARQVTHRNVVRIHDIGEHQGMYFMSMDLVEGRSLQQVLRDERTLDVERAATIVRQIAGALAEAHRKDVVHRDLKPGNILLGNDGAAYVTDFGIARSLTRPGLTRTGEVLGTPDYLSPEQARGEKVDGRSDLYSLGLIFVEMLSGKLPFPGGTLYEVLAQRMTGKMLSLTELGVRVSPAHAAIIRRCVAKDPEERYQSAEELIADLDDLSRPRRLIRRRRLMSLARNAAALVAVAGVAVIGGRWLLPRLAAPPAAPAPSAEAPPVAEPAAPRYSVAVLPFPEESGRDDLAWASNGVAEILATSLAESESLRVVDSVRVFQILTDLGLDPARLRDDQLDQLADVLQVNRLVLGKLRPAGENVQVEVRLVEADEPGVPSRAIGSESGRVETLFELVDQLGGDLREILEVPSSGAPVYTASKSAIRRYAEGLGLLSRGADAEGLAALEQTVAEDPGFTAAWLRLSEAYGDLGRQQEALDAAKQGVLAAGDSSGRAALEARAREALLRGRPGEAQGFLADLVGRYPNDVESHLALAQAFGMQGKFAEGIAQLERAVALDDSESRAWFLLGQFAIRSGDGRRAVDDYLVRALLQRRKAGDRLGEGEIYNALGVGYQNLGRRDEAIENYQAAAEIRRELGDRRGLATTLHNLGWLQLTRGDFDAAEESFRSALEIHTELGNPAGVGDLLNASGNLEEARGRYAEALDLYRRALQTRQDLGDQRALAESRNNVGYAYYLLGEYDNALLNLERALEIQHQSDDPVGVARTLQNIGFSQLARGGWPGALSSFLEALELGREMAQKPEIAVSVGNLGVVAQYQGRYGAALSSYGEALEILTELESRQGQVEFALYQASAWLELGDLEKAGERLDQAGVWQAESGNREQRSKWLSLRAELGIRRGEIREAVPLLEEALVEAEASQSTTARLQAELVQAVAKLAEGDAPGASAFLAPIAAEASRLGHAILELRTAEALARAELATGSLDSAEDRLREALRIADAGGSYARAFELHHLLAKIQLAAGQGDAATRQLRQARAELDKIRDELDDAQRATYDSLPEVRELLAAAG